MTVAERGDRQVVGLDFSVLYHAERTGILLPVNWLSLELRGKLCSHAKPPLSLLVCT